MEHKILIAEDEERIRRLVAGYLVKEGYRPVQAEDGRQAMDLFYENEDIILVILDVMMPEKDGYQVCREIRRNSQVPIVMLTARDTEYDEISGFDCGADEYISKPFSPAVLMARIKNLLRRTAVGSLDDIAVGELEIRYHERAVSLGGQFLTLTPKEFDLLYYMAQNRGIVLTRDRILFTIWGIDYDGDARTVDTHIKCLRAKLGNYGDRIVTIRKVGYKFEG